MYTPEEGHGPVEVALAVVDDADPQAAWRSVDPEALVWRPLADNSGPVSVTVDVAPSHRGVRNLLAVFRGVSCGKRPVFMCMREITICQSLDSLDLQRPRRSPPVQRRHRRIWTDEQRHRARLVEHVAGDLPHLLVEPQLENGLFLRPVEKGANVAIIERGFPRFARSVVAEVEIASEEATSFEFATALGVFGRRLVWNQTMPVSPIAFSGWKLVSSKHARQRIALTVADLIADELDIYLAIRTPAGARIAPSNTYFRKLAFHWDD
jgi:hypothetical protein